MAEGSTQSGPGETRKVTICESDGIVYTPSQKVVLNRPYTPDEVAVVADHARDDTFKEHLARRRTGRTG